MASVESVVWNEACCVISWNRIFDNKIKRTVWHATCPIPFYGLSWSLLSILFAHVPLPLHLLSHCYYIQRFNSISHRMAVSVVDVLGAKWMRFIFMYCWIYLSTIWASDRFVCLVLYIFFDNEMWESWFHIHLVVT